MKLIERKEYLDKLIGVIGTPDIKVITGVRRSGKSKLMDFFEDYIRINDEKANIIRINFNFFDYEKLRKCHALYDYINSQYKDDKHNYVIVDEIQMCKDFEKAINGLHASEKYDVYITGSNTLLLDSELATLFTGRIYEIKVYPFSFAEYVQYFPSSDIYAAFDKYVVEGGMAGSYLYEESEQKYDYIMSVFNTIISTDIRNKYNVKNIALMDRIVDYLLENISNYISGQGIAAALNKNAEKVNHETVGTYIRYLCNVFAFYKVPRYEIQSRKYLSSNEKYYLSDHSFRYAKLGTKNMNYERTLENIVAVELLRRGYEVYTGVLYNKEIDFVALKRNEQLYIQVSDNVSEENTLQNLVSPLLSIRDAYPKIILARTHHDEYQYDGVKIIDVADWLLKK